MEPPAIEKQTTVNHLLRVHPDSRAIFDFFHIDPQKDGDFSLEEVAWYRGLDEETLRFVLVQSLGQKLPPPP
ncbi:MAG: hypothetical protein HYT88_01390 [Candidatus Omnitrophica bacterium]|nr:hypothetical protein [Candidatus Omnitrophota bacterium]